MDLVKIGSYIAGKRKNLGMTQKQLAEKLGMSDKSVSKWERGVCLPDVSVYEDLCRILGITMNEFLAGEDLEQSAMIRKSEENLLSVSKDSQKKQNRMKRVILVLVLLLVVLPVVWNRYNRPVQGISFVADGENYTARVNGERAVLELNNEDNALEWFQVLSPEFLYCSGADVKEGTTEFMIYAKAEGKGEMAFFCEDEVGKKTHYILRMTVSRQRRDALQIEDVSFVQKD